ncbi:MAG: hypothetical protein JWP69_1403 [Flaviaesturariibacter sp.]|nr:hypothetical protein [Flaviaesturariibacter sp.]
MKEKGIKRLLLFFIVSLFISGATAIPVDAELAFLLKTFPGDSMWHSWLKLVLDAFVEVKGKYPFLLYGYDWLAFAHFVLAILFIGPYREPVRNIWVIEFGLIACVLILPFAFIAGGLRGIPFGWQLIDCSFSVVGFAVLWPCYKGIQRLEKEGTANTSQPFKKIP